MSHQRPSYHRHAHDAIKEGKAPRKKQSRPGIYALSGQLFSATSQSDAERQARAWRKMIREKKRDE